jgi:hypothetical protein
VPAINQYNVGKALYLRALRRPKHRPTNLAYNILTGLLPHIMQDYLTPTRVWTFEEWVESMPPHRRLPLRNARANYERTGWHKSYALFHVFGKSEKFNGCKKDPSLCFENTDTLADRIIQAPTDEAHAIAGPRLKPLIEKLKAHWNWRSPIFYASVSSDVLQQWTDHIGIQGRTNICVDYSMFDSTFSKRSWELLEHIYHLCGVDDDEDFRRLLRGWRCPRGHASGKGWFLAYIAEVMNASGRDDTALANAILNALVILVSTTCAYLGKRVASITPSDLQFAWIHLRIAIVGDDSLVFGPLLHETEHRAFQQRLSQNISEFGLDADDTKINVSNDPADAVFLGMRLYPVDGHWLWGRTIGRAVFKFGWKCAPMPPDRGSWMAGEAEAMSITHAHVPILSDLANAYLQWWQHGPRSRPPPDPYRPWTTSGPRPAYQYDTLVHVSRIYGVPFPSLVSCISLIRSISQFPCVINHPALAQMCNHDEF